VLPDFSFLRERAADVDGIVLTHGHEDHVGALAYLLRDVDAPIYGSSLTLGFARTGWMRPGSGKRHRSSRYETASVARSDLSRSSSSR